MEPEPEAIGGPDTNLPAVFHDILTINGNSDLQRTIDLIATVPVICIYLRKLQIFQLLRAAD